MVNVTDKVKKLLRLSTSPNEEEAAAAAAMAQKLILEHNLQQELLSFDPNAEADEEIVDFGSRGEPLEAGSRQRHLIWKSVIANALCRNNGCKIWVQHAGPSKKHIHIIGRPSDVGTVRYMYSYLVNETNRLLRLNGRDMDYSWKKNYALGVAEAIRAKLQTALAEFKETKLLEAGNNVTALAVVNNSLERIDTRRARAEAIMWKIPGMRKGRSRSITGDRNARALGRAHGRTINMGSGRRALKG